jgi:periplasmic divalent cation tolerance protein
MKRTSEFVAVLVTAPDLKTARALTKQALGSRLIACANLLPKLESHFWWQGKVICANEVLLVLKTRRPHLKRLEALILKLHPYDTPEFMVVPFEGGTERYLKWLAEECRPE